MFVYNFKKEFAPAVQRGEKLQTIRPRRADGKMPREGDQVRLFTGMRNRECRWLRDGVVVESFPVYIDFDNPGDRLIVANGNRLGIVLADQFARLDGFSNSREMLAWFKRQYDGDESFDGYCVRWRTVFANASQKAAS